MGLQAVYQQFLTAPNPSLLASDASLHYITTLTSVNGPAEIIKHINGQEHKLKKKEEKFLNVVDGGNSIAAEIHTTIEFQTSGGSYLPGLDDNFLADRTVTFPIIHIVTFDTNNKIQQIRQNWDQGSLLKLIDVIGKSGRNWPIRDGKDQIQLIASSVKHSVVSDKPSTSNGSSERSRGNSNATRDPHASLSLFAPREEVVQESLPAVVAPRSSAKPAPRNYHDLFVGNDSDGSPTTAQQDSPDRASRSTSSHKPAMAKAGATNKFAPSRLFDAQSEEDEFQNDAESTDGKPKDPVYRPNPARYNHFDFTDAPEDEQPIRPLSKGGKGTKGQHQSQWGFDDFVTPQKNVPTKVLRAAEVRHWGNSDDEVMDSPIKMKKMDKPRKDAQPHFEFQDDGTPKAERAIVGRPKGQGQNNGLGLYRDPLLDSDEEEHINARVVPGLSNVKDRRKDFDKHFEMTDDSPKVGAGENGNGVKVGGDRAKAVKMMDANWAAYDSSPVSKPQQEHGPLSEMTNRNEGPVQRGIMTMGDGMGGKKNVVSDELSENKKGIATTGDGMGGKKGAAGRSWGFGDESDGEEQQSVYRKGKAGAGGKSNIVTEDTNENKKGIATTGDGMGGKKGAAGRNWGFGDDSDGEEQGGLNEVRKGKYGKRNNNALNDDLQPMENLNLNENKKQGIATMGDGMGGKKTGRNWGFGDESDGEEVGGLNEVGGKGNKGRFGKRGQQATGGDFWDF
ncbi:hypothetical protein CJF32_00006979 [Rutstroemia sp. NJR-2017a WRK4]|nr:hypothetical protein CJF32_00006979 [Rutstroemia sp. NJR-2017a WRK4]